MMYRPMVYTCLGGVGGVLIIIAGAAICAVGYNNPSQSSPSSPSSSNDSDSTHPSSVTTNNDTRFEEIVDLSDQKLSLVSYGGAVVMGLGCFVVIVSTVVFFEQREQHIRAKIHAEEKAKQKRGYKAKPKKTGSFRRFINGIVQCTDECSRPIKLKHVIPKTEVDFQPQQQKYVIDTQPRSQLPSVASPPGSLSSLKNALAQLPPFKTIDLIMYDDNDNEDRSDANSREGDREETDADRVETFRQTETNSITSSTSFAKLDELADLGSDASSVFRADDSEEDNDEAPQERDDELDPQNNDAASAVKDTEIDDESCQKENNGNDKDIAPNVDANSNGDTNTPTDTNDNNDVKSNMEGDDDDNEHMNNDKEKVDNGEIATLAADNDNNDAHNDNNDAENDNNDTVDDNNGANNDEQLTRRKDTRDANLHNGVMLVNEKHATPRSTPRQGLESDRSKSSVPGRRVPLISDNVERLTCGIARTNAQAMERVRKPQPLPEVLDV